MKILGLKLIYYVKYMESHIRFILYGLTDNKEKISIEIDKENLKIKYVSSFNGLALLPKDGSLIKIPHENDLAELESLLLTNKDNYYRLILNNIDLFTKTTKFKDKRPVWFFKGSNYKGKNYIADKTTISKYIIDEYNFIPDLIECDIIVCPDKYIIPDSIIKSKCIGNNEYISVLFEKKINDKIKYPFRKKRHIYIFIGNSNIGKTYIANSLGLKVFETDHYPKLPDYIEEDIVIFGKIYVYDIDLDIIPRFKGNCHFTFVEFNLIS